MKRILSLMLVLTMLFSTLMLTSCEEVIDFLKEYVPFLEQEDRTTITEEEWEQTKKLSNFSITILSEEENMSVKLAGDRALAYVMGYNFLMDKNTVYILSETPMGFVLSKQHEYEENSVNLSLSEIINIYDLSFDELAYDEESKAYTVSIFDMEYHFEFINGQLVYARAGYPDDPSEYWEITNVGTTVIEFPECILLGDGKVDPNKADPDVRTTITEDEWLAHDMKNYTLTMLQMGIPITIMSTEAATLTKMEYAGEVMQQIQVIIDGYYYQLSQDDDGKYVAANTESEAYSVLGMIVKSVPFETLVYNSENRYYEAEVEGEKAYFYFENGKLTSIVVLNEYEGSFEESLVIVSDIGSTKIDIPEYSVLVKTTVTLAEWVEAMNISNFTQDMILSDVGADGLLTQRSEACMEYGDSAVAMYAGSEVDGYNFEYYYTTIDGVNYRIEEGENGFVATETTVGFAVTLGQLFGSEDEYDDIYNNLIYDYTTSEYSYKREITSGEEVLQLNVKIAFEDGEIKYCTYTVYNESQSTWQSAVVYNFNTTVVELPEFTFAPIVSE